MIGYVYKITLPNDKIYIGSKQSPIFDEKYWGSSCNRFYWEDLEKYGKENCKREIIYEASTLDELLKKEQYFIEQYGLFPKTYNLTTRAKSQKKGFRFSEETKKRMSISHKGQKPSKKAIEATRKRSLENNPMKKLETRKKVSKSLTGRKLSEEHKQHLRENCKGGSIKGCKHIMKEKRCWVSNEYESLCINIKHKNDYLSKGYKPGRKFLTNRTGV